MSGHLQRYQQVEMKYKQEKEDTANQLRQAKLEMQILTSNSDPASIQKAQTAINEMKKEQEEAKKEVQRLRETNKSLLQRNTAEQRSRDRLHKQIADLKHQLAEKGIQVPDDDEDIEETREADKIWGFQPPSPTYRLRHHQEGDTLIINPLDTESEASSDLAYEFVQTKVGSCVPSNSPTTVPSSLAAQTTVTSRSYALQVSSMVSSQHRGNKNLSGSNNSNDSYDDVNDRAAFVNKDW